MSFAAPAFLLALLLIPLTVLALAASRRRATRHAVRFTGVGTLKLAALAVPAWRRHIPAALALAALAALVLALAEPQRTVAVPLERAAIMLVTDHSRSMLANDVEPNRLKAAKRAAATFLDQVPKRVRVGVVAFSDAPDAVQTPSQDRDSVRTVIQEQAADGATATGEALAAALDMLVSDRGERGRKRVPAAVVLLSDGKTTTGRDPVTVAATARRLRIPIFTVALGTRDATVPDPVFGRPLPANPDPETLARIAETSDGRAFTADDSKELSAIYKALGSQLGTKEEKRETTVSFAIIASLLLVGAGAASVRWSGRLP
jgi:Ca-activated chloride channel family protein